MSTLCFDSTLSTNSAEISAVKTLMAEMPWSTKFRGKTRDILADALVTQRDLAVYFRIVPMCPGMLRKELARLDPP
jgi:hypothetical protein